MHFFCEFGKNNNEKGRLKAAFERVLDNKSG